MTKAEFILYVSDQKRSTEFYKKVLSTEPVLDVPGMTEFQLSGECKLGLMPEAGIVNILKDTVPHPSLGNGIPRSELYLFVNHVEAYFRRSLASGAKPVSNPAARDWGDLVAYVSDPDGHILAFAERANS